MSYSQSLFFLFSYELNKKNEKIDFSKGKIVKNIILENQLKKEENNYKIELYEIEMEKFNFFFLAPHINIKIGKDELNMEIPRDEMFMFNEKKDLKVNCLSIEEEFNFYYEFIKKNNNNSKKTLNSLINSIFRILKGKKEHTTLSLLLNIIIIISEEEFLKKYEFIIQKLLLNTDKKGNVSKINKDALYSKLNSKPIFSKNYPYIDCIIAYIILEDRDKLREIIDFKENDTFIFDYLIRYKKLFENYIKFFPDYSFLIDYVSSSKELYNIFHYVKNLSEFIFLLDAKKENIFQLIFLSSFFHRFFQ